MNDKRPPHLPRGIYAFAGDTLPTKRSLVEQVATLLAAGVQCIQIRLKAMPDAQALAQTAQALQYSKAYPHAVFIINDRADMALLSHAHGLHLGAQDIPVPVARQLLGTAALIGKTVRSLEEAQTAQKEGADYIGFGPVFETKTKPLPMAALGVQALRHVAKHSPLPVVAIAGIGAANIAEVAQAGAHAAAVIGDIWQAPCPQQQALKLQQLFAKAGGL